MTTSSSTSIFEQTIVNRDEIPQHALDIDTRLRTNPFPWRGQFSPCLVEILLSTYSKSTDKVADPFAGVGTTLFESARKNIPCSGIELNPAAVTMAETVMFVELSLEKRHAAVCRAEILLDNALGTSEFRLLSGHETATLAPTILEPLARLIRQHVSCPFERNLLANTLIRVLDSKYPTDARQLFRALRQHAEIVFALPHRTNFQWPIDNGDARQLPLPSASVDLAITSPPCINFFNYHQNNRPAMELLGWDLLEVAKSEFGSNRKNRGNRFLTVIQYCLDMQAALIELRRVVKAGGRAIFVVGRQSCVRGVPFQNASLVSSIAEMASFALVTRQERKFKNKFGELIYEDILHLVPKPIVATSESSALQLAVRELQSLVDYPCDSGVKDDLRGAIKSASEVRSSPLYTRRNLEKWKVA